MSISRKITGDASGGSGGSSKYVDDVFSTYLYEGNGADRDIVNGLELGSRPPDMTQSVEWPVGASFEVAANGASLSSSNWTMDYWCKFKAEPTTTMVIYDTRTNDTNSVSWRLVGGELKLLQGNKPDFDTGYYPWVDSPNEWAHHAITLSDGVVSFFVNGIRVATQSVSGTYKANHSQIGRSLYDSVGLGGCLLSNFRINSLKGYGTALTFPVPEGASRLQEDTSNLLFTESDVAPGTSCPRSSQGTDPILYDRARGVNQTGQESQGQDIVPIASADSPYSNSGYEGKGGLVWSKCRTDEFNHALFDTERGGNKGLSSNTNSSGNNDPNITAFNSDGYTVAADAPEINAASNDMASWTFAKQEGFFDVVTYTGQDGHTQPHNLGTVPGMVIVKCTSDTQSPGWIVWHRETGDTGYLVLNETDALNTSSASPRIYNVTDTSFDLGDWAPVSNVGKEYVAYVFADDAPMFGPNGDESIIRCGSYTSTGAQDSRVEIDLGWEPQWVLIKRTDGAQSWHIIDTMRGYAGAGGLTTTALYADSSGVDVSTIDFGTVTPTGFTIGDYGPGDFIYMAIRRPMKPAEEFDPEELFAVFRSDNPAKLGGLPGFRSGFPVDMAFWTTPDGGGTEQYIGGRLMQGSYLKTEQSAEAWTSGTLADNFQFDYNNGYYSDGNAQYQSWMWRRAPGSFDVVMYEGDGVDDKVIPHNLQAVPEMFWMKSSSTTGDWFVYNKDLPLGFGDNYSGHLFLNNANPASTSSAIRMSGLTDESLMCNPQTGMNQPGVDYITYLFASVPGICDIGTYTGTGDWQWIDCGFGAATPRFVLIKSTSEVGDWYYWDSLRGYTSSDNPYLMLNNTDAQVTNTKWIEPNPTGETGGFYITSSSSSQIYKDGVEYIYMAIA